ncbi:MAG: hypothetical protein V4707_02120 [Pseudomonadota bacterium]
MTTVLVVAHPGHELRLSAWVRRTRPTVFVTARGSRSGRSEARIAASHAVVETLGGAAGEPFGAACDIDLYAAIMARDPTLFLALADTLRDAFASVATVVADGWQNYNPVHDLTHLIARVAAAEAGSRFLDYPVVLGGLAHAPDGPLAEVIDLSPDELSEKHTLIARYPEIAEDVAGLTAAAGDAAFARETLHRPLPLGELLPTTTPPWYEIWGEGRVAAGIYAECLRWSHMAPIVAALSARLEAVPMEMRR